MPTNYYLFNLPRWQKRLIMVIADAILLPLAFYLSFTMRLGTWSPNLGDGILLLIASPFLTIPLFIKLGLYRAVIRFLGHQAIMAALIGVGLSTIGLMVIALSFDLWVPRSVYPIYFGTAFLLIGASRHLIRQYYNQTYHRKHRVPVAIYGAGSSGAQLAQALFASPEYSPVLFLDDNINLQKSFIHSLKVYDPKQLNWLIEKHEIKQVLLAMPSTPLSRRREILHTLEQYPLHVRSIPGMADLVSGQRNIEEIREIEIDELLGRQPISPELELLEKCIKNKAICVTGAGGSIGSELCRQIIRLNPRKLVLFELSEFCLYQIERELSELQKHENLSIPLIALLGSVQDQSRLEATLIEHEIDTLYHAAAYKHVPLVEFNPIEGIQNNAIGTWCAASAAYNAKISHFVLISTDKAVRPTNVMGASKRMAELVLQGFAQRQSSTLFAMVRFGNVLGSSGSMVPLFRRQIREGGPITVTHPDIIRFFMTIPEAAQLVIQAGAMAQGGEVFLLDMGEPVKIVDLAQRMIRLSGLKIRDRQNPEGDIEIQFTGLRPGEKLYEELLIENNAQATSHPRIFKAQEAFLHWHELEQMVATLKQACEKRDLETIYHLLSRHVQGYIAPEKKSSNIAIDKVAA